jgi:hypothetical protein
MKIKTKNLTTFFNKALMVGEQQINECILHFEKDGLKINANSPTQQARSISWLKTNAFKEYSDIGKIGVNDIANIVKVLDRFDDMIELTVEGNLMTIKGNNKKVDIELVSESFLSTDTGEPDLKFDDTFVLPAGKIKEIIGDVKLNKDSIITVITEKKTVKISNTGKYKFLHTMEIPTVKGGVKVNFGEPLVNGVINLDGELEFSVKSDYPAKVMEKTENSVITLIIAPRVDENE